MGEAGKLSLLGDEDEPINLGVELSGEDWLKERCGLLGKIITDRSVGKEVLKTGDFQRGWKKSFYRYVRNRVRQVESHGWKTIAFRQ